MPRVPAPAGSSSCWPTRSGSLDAGLIAEGQALVRRCVRRDRPGPDQIAINAVHTDAPTAAAPDWRQIVALYDQLLALTPSAVVALNRTVAVAVAEVDGPAAGLALVDGVDLARRHRLHAIRAALLRRLGRAEEAAEACAAALAPTENAAERVPRARRAALDAQRIVT